MKPEFNSILELACPICDSKKKMNYIREGKNHSYFVCSECKAVVCVPFTLIGSKSE
ncbi:MAG TPA: hypothetical protein VMZ91_04305 [Candidatus Paceibacterota bacterium]|nr:hypothetical protein [Candidatus Paceibacterota bacterium]